MYKFKFADIGEGLHEGTVGEISVKVGDKINEGDTLFVVETDKVTSEIPSPVTGEVKEIMIKEGETVHVGDEIFHIDDGSTGDAAEEVAEAPKKEAGGAASVVGDIKVSDEVKSFDHIESKAPAQASSGSKLSTPLARRHAASKGVDINQVTGTGFNGKVLFADVDAFGGSTAGAPAKAGVKSTFAPSEVKITPMRKAIAKAMKTSWSEAAYTTLTNEVNMTSVWDQRAVMKNKYEINITFTSFIIKATALALQKFPILNSKADEAAGLLINPGVVNMGVAVDTPRGLVVPVIMGADSMSLQEIGAELRTLAVKARDGKLTAKDMSGGTFTITNYGTAGALFGIPVINYPEIGILGTGAIIDKVYSRNNQFSTGKAMNLTCAADHRWIDGGDIGRFITMIKDILESPLLMEVL